MNVATNLFKPTAKLDRRYCLKRMALALLLLPSFCVSVMANNQQKSFNERKHNAQVQSQRYYGQEPVITIYEHCDFKGLSRDVTPGEFRSMRYLDFGNDKMSSMRVPRSLEAVIFQHDNFKGDYARVDRDVRCFDDYWNDEVSSMKVEYSDRESSRPVRDRGQKPQMNSDGVTGNNVSYVSFDQSVLTQVGSRAWQLRDPRRGVIDFDEVSRDANVVNLESRYSPERIRIDLYVNDVTLVNPQGQRRFSIDARRANTPFNPPKGHDTRIPGPCFEYTVYTDGKAGGIRFSIGKDFHRFNDRPHRGQICHTGELVVEINKRDFDTDVTLDIGGQRYKFASGEKETQYRASWYRKVIRLQVGR